MFRNFILAAATAWLLWPGGTASARPLEGITILELTREAAAVLQGSNYTARYLTVFVSASGTYASAGDDGDTRPNCVAWATKTSGETITFGLPPTKQSLELGFSPVCQPFTLSQAGSDRVHIKAANRVSDHSGPLDPQARQRTLSTDLPILARVPPIDIDWGADIFSRYDVRGIHLGPAERVAAAVPQGTKIMRGGMQRTSEETYEHIRFEIPPEPKTVAGQIASAETLNRLDDIVYRLAYHEYLPERVTTEAFAEAIAERYGKALQSGRASSNSGPMLLHWFFDMAGRPVTMADAGSANCLATSEVWLTSPDLRIKGDVGPWGCTFILLLTHDGTRDFVSEYEVTAVSPYVMALNHFAARIAEMKAVKEKIGAVRAFRPKL